MIALFDLNRLEILRIDDHGVVPIPPESGNFDAASAAPLRDDIAPLEITQPEGPGFTLEGRVLAWQRWQVHIGFTPREGLVLNQVAYHDGGRVRSILYRASLSEMVVPYGDPQPDPLLQERVRQRRERHRHRRVTADARLRLPGRDRLSRCDCVGRRGRARAHPERHLPPRAGRRGPLAPHD